MGGSSFGLGQITHKHAKRTLPTSDCLPNLMQFDVKQKPGGGGSSQKKEAGMPVGNFEFPLKETDLGVVQPFLAPKRDHVLKHRQGIDVLENFDHMNQV